MRCGDDLWVGADGHHRSAAVGSFGGGGPEESAILRGVDRGALLENPHCCLVTVKGDEAYHDRQLEVIAGHTQQVADDLGKKGVREVMAQNERLTALRRMVMMRPPGHHPAPLIETCRSRSRRIPPRAPRDRPFFVRTWFCNTISYVNIAINRDLRVTAALLLFYRAPRQMSGVGTLLRRVATALGDCTATSPSLEMGTLNGEARRI